MNHKAASRLKQFGLVLFILCAGFGQAQAGGCFGEGHEVPTPFGLSNQKLELADGEIYDLFGEVVFEGQTPFLKVDLELMPWLASSKRVESPFYRLEGSSRLWRALEGDKVRLRVVAQGRVHRVRSGHGVYEISLKLLPRTSP